jgi:hypothetical protein
MVAGDHKPCEEAEITFGKLRTCALVAAAQDSYRNQVMEFLNASTVVAVPEFGCTPLENAAQIAGNIAVIGRGTCPFAQKASIAQAAGAVAVVITDNRVAVLLKMVGDFSAVAIPAMMVTQDSGAKLRENSGRVATIGIGAPSAAMMSAVTLQSNSTCVCVCVCVCVCACVRARACVHGHVHVRVRT